MSRDTTFVHLLGQLSKLTAPNRSPAHRRAAAEETSDVMALHGVRAYFSAAYRSTPMNAKAMLEEPEHGAARCTGGLIRVIGWLLRWAAPGDIWPH